MLDKFGRIDARTGEYAPDYCRGCDGPLLGHIAEERECQGPALTNEERKAILDRIHDNEHYDAEIFR